MGAVQHLILLLALTAAVVILIRRVYSHVDRELVRLTRAAEDPAFRAGELERLNRLLANQPPPPDDFQPAAGPLPGWLPALPPGFLILAALALAPRVLPIPVPPGRWEVPLAGFFSLAAVGALAAVRGRLTRERLARLWRTRADLRRLDGDRRGAAEDLSASLVLAPWDDSSWAELADDLAASGRLEKAWEAIKLASQLDPLYADHRMAETSLALRLGRLELAGEALRGWRSLTERKRPAAAGEAEAGAVLNDPRIAVYQAALDLAGGGRDSALYGLRGANWEDAALPGLAGDPALAEIMKLFPALER